MQGLKGADFLCFEAAERQCEPPLEDMHCGILVEPLARKFQNLKRLDLGGNKFGDATAQVLAGHLSSGWPLGTLNLEKNCLQAAGAQSLAKVIEWRPIQEMNLEHNPIGTEGEDALREALKTALRRQHKIKFKPYSLLREARVAVAAS